MKTVGHAWYSDPERVGRMAVRWSTVFLALLLLPVTAMAGDPGPDDEALRSQLLAMAEADQQVRERMAALMRELSDGSGPSAELLALLAEQERVDAAHVQQLERIVEADGWPLTDRVGRDAANAAWLILQHADLEVQQRHLPALRAALEAGQADAARAAMLEDRVRMGEGRPQLYGSQLVGRSGEPMALYPVEDPAELDSRRAAVGLPSIDEYLRTIEAELGVPVGRGNLDGGS